MEPIGLISDGQVYDLQTAKALNIQGEELLADSSPEALDILTFSPKKAAVIVKKVLESAIANAEHNEGADVDELRVSTIFVDEGVTMKRISPRAKGRADRILKRTSHITVVVSDS